LQAGEIKLIADCITNAMKLVVALTGVFERLTMPFAESEIGISDWIIEFRSK
jgi:hypothetical protein